MILPRNHKEGGLSVPLFELKSLSQTCVLENATDDYRSARKVGQFRIGEKAAYLPGFPGTRYVPCHLLYYTGYTRTAKNILAEIVRGMFLNNTRHLTLLENMKQHALNAFETLHGGDLEKLGHIVRTTWEQNKTLDAGTTSPAIEHLCEMIDDYCYGYKLPGAGGGGFMYMVAKDPEAAADVDEFEVNAELLMDIRHQVEEHLRCVDDVLGIQLILHEVDRTASEAATHHA